MDRHVIACRVSSRNENQRMLLDARLPLEAPFSASPSGPHLGLGHACADRRLMRWYGWP